MFVKQKAENGAMSQTYWKIVVGSMQGSTFGWALQCKFRAIPVGHLHFSHNKEKRKPTVMSEIDMHEL